MFYKVLATCFLILIIVFVATILLIWTNTDFYVHGINAKKDAHNRYSSFLCIGNPWYYHKIHSAGARNHCRFRNICYDKGRFYFYRHENDINTIPLLYDGFAVEYYNLPDDFSYSDYSPNSKMIFDVNNTMPNDKFLALDYEYILSVNTNRSLITPPFN